MKIIEFDASNGEVIEREANESEIQQRILDEKEFQNRQKMKLELAAKKTALLEKLGITEEEANILLS